MFLQLLALMKQKKYISTNFSLLGTDFLPVHVIYRAEVYVVKEKK